MKIRIRCSAIAHAFEPRLQPLNNGCERVLLNQEQQSFFGLKVVVQPGQRHAGSARQVAHRCAFVSFFAEDIGGVSQNLTQAPVETSDRHAWNSALRSCNAGGAGYRGHEPG